MTSSTATFSTLVTAATCPKGLRMSRTSVKSDYSIKMESQAEKTSKFNGDVAAICKLV